MSLKILPVNDAPTSADNTITIFEDNLYHFLVADFYADAENNPLSAVRFEPITAGLIWVDYDDNGDINGNEALLVEDDIVLLEDITKMRFLPDPDEYGFPYATFRFEVRT